MSFVIHLLELAVNRFCATWISSTDMADFGSSQDISNPADVMNWL